MATETGSVRPVPSGRASRPAFGWGRSPCRPVEGDGWVNWSGLASLILPMTRRSPIWCVVCCR